MQERQVIIVGSGPAGLTAAIYAARANLSPLVFAGAQYGGQLMLTTEVENYPGFPEGIQGPELMDKMLKQAERFGAQIVYQDVTDMNISNQGQIEIVVDSQKYPTKTVILAMGSYAKKLGLESESRLMGRGVSTCATCDGAFYNGRKVAIVGGGDSAMEEAVFLTRFAKKVYVIHRRDTFRASKIMVDRVLKHEKIEVLFSTEVKEILGQDKVEALILLNNQNNEESTLKVDGLFIAIGHVPATSFLNSDNQIEIELDDHGYVKTATSNSTMTNVNGVFVAGDVYDSYYQQAVTAAASGCQAAIDAEKWLEAST